jgi:hypothetical protein
VISQYKRKDSGAPGIWIIVLAITLRAAFLAPFLIASYVLIGSGQPPGLESMMILAAGAYAMKSLPD